MTVFLAALTSFALAFLASPPLRKVALRIRATDLPGTRHIHRVPVPFLGGTAVFIGFAVAVLVFGRLDMATSGLLAGGAVVFGVGLLDDVHELRPVQKLIGQVAGVSLLVVCGGRIEVITSPLGGMLDAGWLSVPATFAWVLLLINVVNLTDGVDGAATGICAVTAGTILAVSLMRGRVETAVLSAALMGAALGFLPFNLHPARMFLGDSGALFAGYAVASISTVGAIKAPTVLAVGVPLLVLGLPLADAAAVVIERARRGKSVFVGDRRHLHHILLDRGFSQGQISALYVCVSVLGGGLAVILSTSRESGPIATAALVIAVSLAVSTVIRLRLR